METINAFSEWLKTSVFGIIILGAGGSIVSVLLLNAAKKLLREVIPFQRLKLRLLRSSRYYRDAYVLGILSAENEVESIATYFTYRVVRIMFMLSAAVTSFVLFLFLIGREGNIVLTFGAYSALVVGMVSAYFAYAEFWYIRLAFGRRIPALREKGDEVFLNNLRDGSLLESLKQSQQEQASEPVEGKDV